MEDNRLDRVEVGEGEIKDEAGNLYVQSSAKAAGSMTNKLSCDRKKYKTIGIMWIIGIN